MTGWTAWVASGGGLLVGLVSCGWMTVVDWTAWILVLPGRKRGALSDPETAPGEPIEAVAADGARLAGFWFPRIPTAPPRGVLLMLHGFAEVSTSLNGRVEAMTRHGWDVAAIDNRAQGRSEGDRGSFGGREGADLSAWIDLLVESGRLGPAVTNGRNGLGHSLEERVVAVWGRSMGSAVALRAAAGDARITALVLEAPYLDLAATLATVVRGKGLPASNLLARAILRRAERLAGVSLQRPRPVDLARRYRGRVLIVAGSDDRLVSPTDAQRLAGAFPSPATLVVVPGAAHRDVIERGGAPLIETIVGFLDTAVPGQGPCESARSGLTRAG